MRRRPPVVHLEPMAVYLLEHRHRSTDCGVAFAAWKGVDSPLRDTMVLSSCAFGEHRLWFVIEAPDETAALSHLPRYLAERASATRVAEVPIP